MLQLKADRKTTLSINLDVERLYNQILSEKKRLQPVNSETEEFLNEFPAKLLRKAAQRLVKNDGVTAYKFVKGRVALEVSKDPQTQLVRLKLQTNTQ